MRIAADFIQPETDEFAKDSSFYKQPGGEGGEGATGKGAGQIICLL